MPEKVPTNVEVFHWRGQTRYRCPLFWESGAKCMYDTHSVTELRAHMTKGNHKRAVEVPQTEKIPETIISEPVATEFENLKFKDSETTESD